MELREKFILPEGTTQVMASFRYRGRRSRPSSRGASPNRSTSSQSCLVHPTATTTTAKVSGSSRSPIARPFHAHCVPHSLTSTLFDYILFVFCTSSDSPELPFVNPCLFSFFVFLPFYHDLPLFLRINNTLPEIMISPGLQTANPPPLLNHQTPSGAKVHPQRYRRLQNKTWDVFTFGTQVKLKTQ